MLVREWAARIEAALKSDSNRPSALLAIANPYGGARKALKVYEKMVAPIMDRAGGRLICPPRKLARLPIL